ncbi:hypothetical protein [Acinetobacter pragensis]|uniref:hypothetical protein n=1 Tax=Acinetobacter pragensis TaxID=1806892 RepID=UPI00333FBC3C
MRINSQISQHLKTALLSVIVLTVSVAHVEAKTALSDAKLENAVDVDSFISQQALQEAAWGTQKSKTEQQEDSNEKASSNSKQIQENSLDGSEMSEYVLQKKRAGASMPSGKSAEIPDVRRIVHQEKYENIRISYPDGLVVEMKRN